MGPTVKSQFRLGTERVALAWTPHNPLYVFFNPAWIGLNAAGRNLGNEALIFHEALHGITGLQDSRLEAALGWPGIPVFYASCKINMVIQRDVLLFAPNLDPQVNMPCARRYSTNP